MIAKISVSYSKEQPHGHQRGQASGGMLAQHTGLSWNVCMLMTFISLCWPSVSGLLSVASDCPFVTPNLERGYCESWDAMAPDLKSGPGGR